MKWPVALALALALASPGVRANGRAPVTNGIYFRPGDAHALYIRTTFGLLISHDDGCDVRWVCERAIGYGGLFDPRYAIDDDGTIFAGTYAGLQISHDGGCSFTTSTALPPDTWIDAVDLGPTGELWLGTASSGAPNDVYASSDGGRTFASRGRRSGTIWWKSVKVAPSDARRVYIAGYQVAGVRPGGGAMLPAAHVLRSDDDGAHWIESPLASVRYGSTPIVLIGAVDPRDSGVAYLISIAANPPVGDRLYRTGDGGATWREVLATTGPIASVVVHDATTVLATTQLAGSFVSRDAGATFAPLPHAPQLACLAQRGDGVLIGCASNWAPDQMALATSRDGGATWQRLWQLGQLSGPLACPAGTAEHDVCAQQPWTMLQAQFGAKAPRCPAPPPPPAPHPHPAAVTKTAAKHGCCDAGGTSGGGLLLAAVLALGLGRRRHS